LHLSSDFPLDAHPPLGPEDPLAWLRALVSKALALGEWQARVGTGVLLKSPLALTELFRPETFLNALRQQTARLSK
jgi:dynein heavy chain 2